MVEGRGSVDDDLAGVKSTIVKLTVVKWVMLIFGSCAAGRLVVAGFEKEIKITSVLVGAERNQIRIGNRHWKLEVVSVNLTTVILRILTLFEKTLPVEPEIGFGSRSHNRNKDLQKSFIHYSEK